LILALLFLASQSAMAQLPPPDQLRAELAGLYQTSAAKPIIHDPSSPWQKRVTFALRKQSAYLVSQLHPWSGDPAALTMTPSLSKEHDIRPNAHLVFGLAALATTVPDDPNSTMTGALAREKAIGLLRFILPTHGAGGKPCSDGKQWHAQWQSALWANSAGRGCWLLWDKLPADLQWLAARMICDEADRFIDQPPPSQVNNDTKAEENAWNSTVISLAYCMFPHHPHSEQWRTTAIRWAISSFARQADLNSTAVYDGRTVAEWLHGQGANIHDDYTLENHNRVHPDYMNTVNICLYQRELYEWAGKPVPQALDFNTTQVYATLKSLSLPDGGYIYPNGQDWGLRRNPHWTETHMMQAVRFRDPEASRLLANGFDALERMLARTPDGGVFLPEEFNFPSTQQFMLEMLAMMHHLVGSLGEPVAPVSEEQFRASQAGLHMFGAGKFAVQRTTSTIASFSWGAQVMGQVYPLERDLLLAPNERSLIGRMQFEGVKGDPLKVKSAKVLDSRDTLGVIGNISRAGAADQAFAFVALPDGRCIYADRVSVTTNARVLQMDLGTLNVLNDQHWINSPGKRTLYHDGASDLIMSEGPANDPPLKLASNWYNIDDRLGICVLSGSGQQQYVQNHKIGNGRLEQQFILSQRGKNEATRSTGPTILTFYPGQGHSSTPVVLGKSHAEISKNGNSVAVTLDDNKRVLIDFATNELSVK
jgi:hypothetical protein